MTQTLGSVNYKVARNMMKALASQAKAGFLDNVAVSKKDWDDVSKESIWVGPERNRITAAFYALLTSATDAFGFDRIKLPAEWIAAGIALWVAPCNWLTACRFFENQNITTADNQGRGKAGDDYYVSGDQLAAIVAQLEGDPDQSAAAYDFYRNTGIAIERFKLDIEAQVASEKAKTTTSKK
ncbi:scaffold protein [Microviridae sp.]|nr:scaffold protein [Microviridae sp.]